ncbi:MAG: hypothetical protein ACLQK4_12445 [Acidimicrobiales bacterium]|jgi:hypothetical protein
MSPTLAGSNTRHATALPAARNPGKLLRSIAGRAAVLAVVLVVAFATPALAGGGQKNEPQPELAPFKVGAAGGGMGSGALLANGNIVLASPSESGSTATVCVVHPGARDCASTATLHAYHGHGNTDTFYGSAEVFATGATDVSVVLYDCCYIPNPVLGGVVIFNSTDGGKTFGSEIPAGRYIPGITVGTYADGKFVVAPDNNGAGTQLQAYSPHPSKVEDEVATAGKSTVEGIALTTYKDGVLVASDNGTSTTVYYAKKGTDFNSSKSYKKVGSIHNETVFGISDDALLTNPGGSLTHGANLRFFNGTSFGSAHKVPEPNGGDDGYFSVLDDRGTTHVFFVSRGSYDVYSEWTHNGVHWAGYAVYAATVGGFPSLVPVLDKIGAGICYETDNKPLVAQPILDSQFVKASFTSSKVHAGSSTTLKGTVKPVLNKKTVTLQRLSGGLWYKVSTTKESSSGTFSFKVTPSATDKYRAMVNYDPGYYEYGYSTGTTVTVEP